ncbi:hypothetical protein DFH08DRAFT_721282, partial [Mycena albidolilacea]
MASLYLLKNPDHYTNYKFKVFWWKSYVAAVRIAWNADNVPTYPVQTNDGVDDLDKETDVEQVVLIKSKGGVVAATNVDDYVSRPKSFEHVSLYEFIQMTTRVRRTPKQQKDFLESLKEADSDAMFVDETAEETEEWLVQDTTDAQVEDLLDLTSGEVSVHAYAKDHPLWETHYLRCDRKNLEVMVPNFVGGSLPRMDQGDREYYCCTMLTLFKPWRNGLDLKLDADSWHETFIEHQFTDRAQTLMKHFNVRYECNDARDDYSTLDKKKRRALPLFGGNQHPAMDGDESDKTYCDWDDGCPEDAAQEMVKGPKQLRKEKSMKEVERVLHTAGWTAV